MIPDPGMFRRMALCVAQSRIRPVWRTSSVPNDLSPELQRVLDRNPDVDWEYVEGYFDNTPESEWDVVGLEEYMDAYHTYREGSAFRMAARHLADEGSFPKRIQIKSPHWEPWPAGSAYDEWDERHEEESGSDEDINLLVNATKEGRELMEGTGCSLPEEDPHHDPDKIWVDCPDQESYDALMHLMKSSRFKAKTSDPHWWLWMTYKDAEITELDLDVKDYDPEHLIESEEGGLVLPGGSKLHFPERDTSPKLELVQGGRESALMRMALVLVTADEADLDELGMSADFGPDQDSMSTHTDLEEEDLETTDTRTSLKQKDRPCKCGGPCKCGPSCKCKS